MNEFTSKLACIVGFFLPIAIWLVAKEITDFFRSRKPKTYNPEKAVLEIGGQKIIPQKTVQIGERHFEKWMMIIEHKNLGKIELWLCGCQECSKKIMSIKQSQP